MRKRWWEHEPEGAALVRYQDRPQGHWVNMMTKIGVLRTVRAEDIQPFLYAPRLPMRVMRL